MGGYGSGRPATSPTIEGTASLALDVNRVMAPVMRALRRHGMAGVPEGQTVTLAPPAWRWTRAGEAEPWAEVRISLTLGPDWGEAVLSYDIDHLTCPTGPQRETVRLATSPCRFGGVRWWWVCPASGRCCAKLYLPNGGRWFLSRDAYRLGYASQRGTWIDRAHGRARRLHRKLGSDCYAFHQAIPDKPKRMRWRTYERIAAALIETEAQLDHDFIAGAERILARIERRER